MRGHARVCVLAPVRVFVLVRAYVHGRQRKGEEEEEELRGQARRRVELSPSPSTMEYLRATTAGGGFALI